MSLTHYKASWVGTPSEDPVWPPAPAVSPLYGPGKAPLNIPLVIENVPGGTLTFQPARISGKVLLRVAADGAKLLDVELEPKQGPGWTNVVYQEKWRITQGRCLTEQRARVPAGVSRLTLEVAAGDWAEVSHLRLTAADGRSATLAFEQRWGETNAVLRFAGFGADPAFQLTGGWRTGADTIREECLRPWQPAFDAGIHVMVGEFGAFNQTPHPLVLRWMEDNLQIWKERDLGWALWNFRGPFGVLDSERRDVAYETFRGHKLDRKMLELLQRY